MSEHQLGGTPTPEGELELKDIFNFIATSWKKMAIGGFIGLLCAIVFLFITPKEYEGIVQVQMAQLVAIGNRIGNINNVPVVSVEEPNLLIDRLKIPSAYSEKMVAACGYESDGQALGSFKIANAITPGTPPRGVKDVAAFKFRSTRPEVVKACLEELYVMVKAQQEKITNGYAEVAANQIKNAQSEMATLREKMKNSADTPMGSWAYYFNISEARRLSEQIENMQNFIELGKVQGTRLVGPVYVQAQPVYPRRLVSLAVGVLAGITLITALLLLQKAYRALRN